MSSLEASKPVTESTGSDPPNSTASMHFNKHATADMYLNNAKSISKVHVNNLNSILSEDRNHLPSCAIPSDSNSGGITNGVSNNEPRYELFEGNNPVNGCDAATEIMSSVEVELDTSEIDSQSVSLLQNATDMEQLLQSDYEDSSVSKSDMDGEQKSDFSGALSHDKTSVVSEHSKDVEQLSTSLEKALVSENSSLDLHSDTIDGITYVVYKSEKQMPDIMRLITKDLSEPYSIYTYRYFIHNWPKLCFLAMDGDVCIGAIVCKLDLHKKMARRRGYIAMLAVDSAYRRRKLGSTLVTKAIQAMIRDDCDEVVLETEITNQAALHLYENLGFVRDKRLFRYYLNGVDALRLKLWLR